jgi:hypothetical protein
MEINQAFALLGKEMQITQTSDRDPALKTTGCASRD